MSASNRERPKVESGSDRLRETVQGGVVEDREKENPKHQHQKRVVPVDWILQCVSRRGAYCCGADESYPVFPILGSGVAVPVGFSSHYRQCVCQAQRLQPVEACSRRRNKRFEGLAKFDWVVEDNWGRLQIPTASGVSRGVQKEISRIKAHIFVGYTSISASFFSHHPGKLLRCTL